MLNSNQNHEIVWMVDGEKTSTRVRDAKQSRRPAELRVYAQDSSREVRGAVAINQYTPPEVLYHLWETEKSSFISQKLAGNRSTPVEVLVQLASDTRKSVSVQALDNRSTPVEVVYHVVTLINFPKWRAKSLFNKIMREPDWRAHMFNLMEKDGWVDDWSVFEMLTDEVVKTYFWGWLDEEKVKAQDYQFDNS